MPETVAKPPKRASKPAGKGKAKPTVKNPVKPANKPKMGAPSKYSDIIARVICIRLSNGESLAQITKDDDMPSQATVYNWLLLHADFLEMYTRAREEQADTNADEILAIADEHPPEYTDKDGRTTLDATYIAWQKSRIEARKWTAMKLKPRKYGDRVGIEGVEGGAPITTQDLSATRLADIIRNLEMSKRVG